MNSRRSFMHRALAIAAGVVAVPTLARTAEPRSSTLRHCGSGYGWCLRDPAASAVWPELAFSCNHDANFAPCRWRRAMQLFMSSTSSF